MGNNTLLHNLTHLADIVSVGLSEVTDYVATNVEIIDGKLTEVAVSEVPRLDDTQFYYTSSETYFNVNKPSVTAGNYLTLQAHIDFKAEHADKVDGVTLTIDLPEGCQMVENSVIANRQAVAHTVNGNRVTIPLTKEQYESQLRFCVIPTLNQNYTITAMASFNVDGQITQPIGSAQFDVKGLSLSAPEIVTNTNITINGTAKGKSDVNIYDNDVLIGKTTSKADGSWTADCELFKPYSHSFHNIYAKITTENGMELTSEEQQVEYDKNGNVPEKVTMTFYNGWMNKNINVEFNLLNGTTTPSSYPFYSGTDFTFLADFTHNDSTEIKNVNIKVLNSDGTVRTLPATFDGKQNKWVATTKYESSNKLPTNVAVEYDLLSCSELYDEEMEEAKTTLISNMLTEVENAYKDCAVELTDENENSIFLMAKTNGYESKENFTISILDYDEVKAQYADTLVCQIINDTTDVCFVVNTYEEYRSGIVVWDNLNKAAFEITMDGVSPPNMSKRRRIIPFLLWATYGVGTAVFEYNMRMPEILRWRRLLEKEVNNHGKNYETALKLLYAKCPDGSYKIKDESVRNELRQEAEQYLASIRQFLDDFRIVLDRQQLRLQQLCSLKGIFNVALSAVGGLILKGVGRAFANVEGTILNSFGRALSNQGITALTEVAGQGILSVTGYNPEYPTDEEGHVLDISLEQIISKWHSEHLRELTDEYVSLAHSIKGSYSDCKKEKDEEDEPKDEQDNDDFDGDGTTPEIDPSGYVYEAVISNRLEGVTATCYQKVQTEDMYGDITEEAVVWNAEDYSQQNPLKTDETGFYRWDVPQGMWQVKYEKEGYETTYSDWLPVPPPQLDVNICMKQNTPPTVKQMRGYESGITIELSKYMLPGTMTTENITVTHNGKDVKGTIELLNAEKAPLEDKKYVSKVKFVPENRFNNSDIVVVTVHKNVESYCNVKMTTDHVEAVTIESEIEEFVVENPLTVPYDGTKTITVEVLSAFASAGKKLNVKTSSSMILSVEKESYIIDEEGKAEITLTGELPGTAALTFSVDGTDKEALTIVNVAQIEPVATPTASIASGSIVKKGTQIELFCSTEGATIYYTLDGSCPCVNSEARKVYDGTPITIEMNTIIKAMAAAPDMEESEVATFVYIVTNGDLNVDGKVDIADGVVVLNIMAASGYQEFADLNQDQKVDIADFVCILNIMAQLSDQQKLVTAIVLSETSISLQPNEIKILTATVLPENADNKEIAWESSDINIATVNQTGKVTAQAIGTCIITCSAMDGSGVKAECKVTVNGLTPDPGNHEYVDLGLPSGTLWATCNVGASSPEEYGDYFAWGETTGYNSGKTDFNWSTYTYCQGSDKTLTKYCMSSSKGTVDNKTELELGDDAATANWGSAWKMPSIDQFKELINRNYTTKEWTSLNGKYGWKITSKNNGKSIFFPAAGYLKDAGLDKAGSYGNYWTLSLNASFIDLSGYACELYFSSSSISTYDYGLRCYGQSVRPVRVDSVEQ